MQTHHSQRTFYFQADASGLGGVLQKPLLLNIPSQASVSLSSSGGFATGICERFNVEGLVSCARTESRLSGRRTDEGRFSTLVTTIVEDLNILEIVRAKRVVAQVSATTSADGREQTVSFSGSQFEGLCIAGREVSVELDQGLVGPAVSWNDFKRAEHDQRRRVTDRLAAERDLGDWTWALERYGWSENSVPHNEFLSLCSLAYSVERMPRGSALGPFIQIPEFGRLFLGELQVSRHSVRLSMLRADLGCNVHGSVTAAHSGSGGTMMPPVG